MEPWETLDVDDSDLPSLLRTCKRPHGHQDNSISIAAGISISRQALKTCSNASQTLLDTEAEEDARQEVVKGFTSGFHSKSEQHCLIPGPAGAVQAAMLQKTIDRQNHYFSSSQGANLIATQEYIKRAVENAPEFDEDFSSKAWISALQFIGTRDGIVPSIPLRCINECKIVGKADQVVAVISSRTQTSFGVMMLILKDPTGTIGASVHHKVLGESNYGKDFSVGSVVILQKVSIFSPSTSVHYLNIMLRNVLKVFHKDIGLPSQHHCLEHSIKYAVPVFSGRASSLKKITPALGPCENMKGMRKYKNSEVRLDHNTQIEDEVLCPGSSKCSSRSSFGKDAVQDIDPAIQTQGSAQGLCKAEVIKTNAIDKRGSPGVHDGDQKFCHPQESFGGNDAANHMMMNNTGQKTGVNIVQSQNQQLLEAASLPEWTDEQLAELLVGDDDDENNGSFC